MAISEKESLHQLITNCKIEAIKDNQMRKEYRHMFFTQFIDMNEYKRLQSEFLKKYGHIGYVGCEKLYLSIYGRTRRLKNRLACIIEDAQCTDYGLYFITMTFNDDYLNQTQEDYRRKLVQRLLNEFCRHYVGNIDFGNDDRFTHREHYHAFISTDKIQALIKRFNEITDSYLYVEKYRITYHLSSKRLTKYVIKLGNHALKDSTKNNVLLYDRKKEYLIRELE